MQQFPPPEPQDVVVEDDDPVHVVYDRKDAWTSATHPRYHGSSYHRTNANVDGAVVRFSFTGSYVAYYSDRNDDHGSFNVSVDNRPALELSSYSAVLAENQMLYSVLLPYGPHTLTISNNEASKVVGVDYFVYRPFTSSVSTSFSLPSKARSTTTSGSAKPSPNGAHFEPVQPEIDPVAAVGIAFGVLASVMLLVLCVIAIRRHKTGMHRMHPGTGTFARKELAA